ncbi:MAG: argininosuccinate synthase [Candidatus Omnitrophica bacterium]|nr:argininosuccinate synthase [Candidatus Omnitrophota bacterium]
MRLSLFKGSCTPVGRESPNSLYSTAIATFGDSGELYSHSDGTGFIKLFGLPLEIRGRMNREKS